MCGETRAVMYWTLSPGSSHINLASLTLVSATSAFAAPSPSHSFPPSPSASSLSAGAGRMRYCGRVLPASWTIFPALSCVSAGRGGRSNRLPWGHTMPPTCCQPGSNPGILDAGHNDGIPHDEPCPWRCCRSYRRYRGREPHQPRAVWRCCQPEYYRVTGDC